MYLFYLSYHVNRLSNAHYAATKLLHIDGKYQEEVPDAINTEQVSEMEVIDLNFDHESDILNTLVVFVSY